MAKTKRKYTRRKDEDEDEVKRLKVPELNLAQDTKRSIAVIVFLILAAVIALALVGSAGPLGEQLNRFLAMLFGLMSYTVPVLLGLIALILFQSKLKEVDAEFEDEPEEKPAHPYARTYIGIFLMTAGAAGLLHALYIDEGQTAMSLASEGLAGGYLGAIIAGPLLSYLGFWAGGLIIVGILIIGILIAFNLSPTKLFEKKPDENLEEKVAELKINAMNDQIDSGNDDEEEEDYKEEEEVATETKINLPSSQPSKADEAISTMESIILEDRRDWKLPPFDLLNDNKSKVDSGDIEANVALIQKTLSDFGIKVEMGEVNVGPTVTQYTFAPAAGVRLNQIAALQSNLALALAAPQSLRMELPIPGKALVGIEVPNKATAMVNLREVMQTSDFVNNKAKLTLALGRDVAGKPSIVDLAKMPHLLIAGTTGSGKSVAINSLIVSLLYRNTPQDVKFIFIDPKHVELTPYNGIPHLLTPAITDADKAINALKWVVSEMERRYKLVAEAGKRNILEYNEKNELPLPYIVVVVDELANLMAVGKQDVETSIVKLASLARAVGIHLVLATQRPSTEVITGLIKANISTRIAFKLPSQIDSRTIIDSSGAEKLLGNGDMLFVTAESSKPRRIQGTYIVANEIHRVVDFFKQQTGVVIYNEEIVEKAKRGVSGIPGMDGDDDNGDELFDEAKEEVLRAGKASASLLQRRLRVGYSRAARLIDLLEEKGIVGPPDGAKPREVYGVSDGERAEHGGEDQEI
ncbi:TPA: cell division protein FtsK [Patescibacteria group bacterium]|jgi:S-DNA-T family DNA segregation ATPase FtsK/SpoIIIE|nr:cell division protein FtsK [Patescibacteria group bacterium]